MREDKLIMIANYTAIKFAQFLDDQLLHYGPFTIEEALYTRMMTAKIIYKNTQYILYGEDLAALRRDSDE